MGFLIRQLNFEAIILFWIIPVRRALIREGSRSRKSFRVPRGNKAERDDERSGYPQRGLSGSSLLTACRNAIQATGTRRPSRARKGTQYIAGHLRTCASSDPWKSKTCLRKKKTHYPQSNDLKSSQTKGADETTFFSGNFGSELSFNETVRIGDVLLRCDCRVI